MNETNCFRLPPIEATADLALQAGLRHKIDHKTKPLGALGQLEDLALQLGLIQRSDVVSFHAPQIVVFAADHGIAAEGVSAYPQAVTAQMVVNMLAGGAAVNVLARQHGFALHVVDAGVATELRAHPQLISRKIAYGTQNLCKGPAMSAEQLLAALEAGAQTVKDLPGNVIALGEMGIANTSSAALLLNRLAGTALKDATGRGTGISDAQLKQKRRVLLLALMRHQDATLPMQALADLGGFEIAMMVGAMLQAASQRGLAERFGVSLGKVNYCLRALVDKGLVKANNFRRSDNKLAYSYVLTPAGLEEKGRLTKAFLRRKLTEYELLQQEIEVLRREAGQA